jgi:hypothetical protein
MRKLPLAVVAASAAVMLLPMASAFASTGHVLTISKKGGTAVKDKAVLKAGLAKGKTATFTLGTVATVTCKTSTFAAKVTDNPAKPGTAKESVTSQSFSKCKASLTGLTVKSVKVNNLPYDATVSDKGDVVKISGASKSKPLSFTATVDYSGDTFACTDNAKSISGKASNTGNTITFTKQKFTPAPGGNSLCTSVAPTTDFSATFGPVKDTSVKGSPKVFVN